MIYTHVLNRGGKGVRSPLDHLSKAIEGQTGMSVLRDGRVRQECPSYVTEGSDRNVCPT